METRQGKDNIRFLDKCNIKRQDIDDDYKLKENFIKMREISIAESLFVLASILCSILFYEASQLKNISDDNQKFYEKVTLSLTTACSLSSSKL
jgi:hypothetical protein